jgi:maltooligosyltrehalose trehalohydrolase
MSLEFVSLAGVSFINRLLSLAFLAEQALPEEPRARALVRQRDDRMNRKQTTFQFGPVHIGDRTRFSIWAPRCDAVSLMLDEDPARSMAAADGWHTREVDGHAVGRRYQFRLPDGLLVPDPASRYQPLDVHGPSEVVDARYDWTTAWAGRPWEEAVIYELHIGTFTGEGTFRAATERLAYL